MADLDVSAVDCPHWGKGDFTRISETTRECGEELVATLGIEPRMEVPDHGRGDGAPALPGTRLGADVVGIELLLTVLARLENAATRLW